MNFFLGRPQERARNIHNTLKELQDLLAVDRVDLGVGEFEFGEFGHVDSFAAAAVLREFVQFLFHLTVAAAKKVTVN